MTDTPRSLKLPIGIEPFEFGVYLYPCQSIAGIGGQALPEAHPMGDRYGQGPHISPQGALGGVEISGRSPGSEHGQR